MSFSKVDSYRKPNSNAFARALGHPNNFEPILLCTLAFIAIGLLMMLAGGLVCLVYYTQITPPNFDINYQRYVGSSVARIVGK